MIGRSLGPYRILERLGAGGMGEVWLAEDTRLGRKVAVKVLPSEFAEIPERLARFEQEARAAASLNNPHIAAIFDVGFEPASPADGGEAPDDDGSGGAAAGGGGVVTGGGAVADTSARAAGIHFMVQEYLEGKTLRGTIDAGRPPLKRALRFAVEIAGGLTAAHDAGIIHRDLKPENVFVTKDGHVKILDFGLAKLTELSITASPGTSAGTELAKSPTLIGTVAGQIMGTAGYMAPEQVDGAEIDQRADLFALGCVLYELAAGRRPFSGRSVHETLSQIVHEEPPALAEIDRGLPYELQRILRKSLQKDRAVRYQHADELLVDLGALLAEVESGASFPTVASSGAAADAAGAVAAPRPRSKLGPPIPLGAAALLAVAVAVAAWVAAISSAPEPEPQPLTRLTMNLGEDDVVNLAEAQSVIISPDGRQVVYASDRGDGRLLYYRGLDQLEATPMPGTENAHAPFFSPDSEWVGFFDNNTLKKVTLDGRRPLELCDVTTPAWGTWAEDGTIYFTVEGSKMYRVSDAGGSPELLLDVADQEEIVGFTNVEALPGPRRLLLYSGITGSPRLAIYDLGSGALTLLEEAGDATAAHYARSGHLIFSVDNGFVAVPFDAATGRITGERRPLQFTTPVHPNWGVADYSLSTGGTLVYLPGAAASGGRQLVWVDRSGNATPVIDEHHEFDVPRLSPDGRRIAVAIGTPGSMDIWILDSDPEPTLRKWTFENDSRHPNWSPDGSELLFRAVPEGGTMAIFKKSAVDSIAPATKILETGHSINPGGWTLDGKLVFHDLVPEGNQRDILVSSIDGGGDPSPFLATEFNERQPVVSPDGAWIAYASNQSGRDEVYIRAYPGPGGDLPISNQGGSEPMWSRDGNSVFFRALSGEMMEARLAWQPAPRVEGREALFDSSPYLTNGARTAYDVDLDGERFLMVKVQETGAAPQLVVVTGWFQALEAAFAGSR